jgi:hypothetical protein
LRVDTKATSEQALKTPGDSPLLSLPFDHYQRYALTQKLVNHLRPHGESSQLRVLDVGGSSSSLKHFLPDDDVVLADVQEPPTFTYREVVPFRYDAYVLGAGQQLPFADACFDVVTAHDTLEHVPPEYREGFLQDLIRVSKRYVIVSGPIFQIETAAAERRLAEYMDRAFGGSNVSLTEHIELGLPDEEFIASALTSGTAGVVSVSTGNLMNWLTMMALKYYLVAFPDSDELHEALDRTYNTVVSPRDFAGQCYRKTYAAAKDSRDMKSLRSFEENFESLSAQPVDLRAPEVLELLLSALEDHASTVGKNVPVLRASVSRLEGEVTQRDAAIADLRAVLARTEKEVVHLQSEFDQQTARVRERDEKLRHVETELMKVRRSTGYRLLKLYRGGTRRMFPPNSPLGTAYQGLLWPVKRLLDVGSDVRRKGRRNG